MRNSSTRRVVQAGSSVVTSVIGRSQCGVGVLGSATELGRKTVPVALSPHSCRAVLAFETPGIPRYGFGQELKLATHVSQSPGGRAENMQPRLARSTADQSANLA